MKCPVCGSEQSKKLFSNLAGQQYTAQTFSLLKCRQCQAGFLDPQMQFEEVEAACYGEQYHAYQTYDTKPKNVRQKVKAWIKRNALAYFFGYGAKKWWQVITYSPFLRMSFYPARVQGGKILDIGCGAGKYLHYLKELGWDVAGVDISARAVAQAKASGLTNIQQGTLETVHFPDNSFDVVNLHHVFEHLLNPNETLKEIYRILKPGGEVIITLPNLNSLAAKLFRTKWGGIDVPRHVIDYNEPSLKFVLEHNHFKPYKFWYSDTFRGFSAGFSYLFTKDGRKYEKYFLPLGILLDLILEPVFELLKTGDQITVKARK